MSIATWEFESPPLHKNKDSGNNRYCCCSLGNLSCGNSSVGRARPCQGRGREFESRSSLRENIAGLVPAFIF